MNSIFIIIFVIVVSYITVLGTYVYIHSNGHAKSVSVKYSPDINGGTLNMFIHLYVHMYVYVYHMMYIVYSGIYSFSY